jgi:HEAT repeat protein
MKILKEIFFAAIILCLMGAGWAQGQGERSDTTTMQASSITATVVRITTNPFEASSSKKDVKYVASDADVEKWGKWLDDSAVFGREEGADWLGRSNNPKAVDYLLKALKDPEPSVRARPAGYLSNFQDERIRPALMAAVKTEKSLLVQRALMNSIRKIGATSEDERMIKKSNENLTKELRKIALDGKEGHGKIRAIWEIVSFLNEDPQKYEDSVIKTLEADSSEEDKILAIRLLGKTHTEKSASALNKARKNRSQSISVEAESTLKQMKSKLK